MVLEKMEIYNLFDISLDKKELISFVGGGGKTTTLFKLSKELKQKGKRVLVTTTTAIYFPHKEDYDKIIIGDSDKVIEKLRNIKNGTITIVGAKISKENKLKGIKKEIIDDIYNKDMFDYILVEADGSKRKPIKAPAEHEPVIPINNYKTIGVIGLDALGTEIKEENVHRPEIFCSITGSKINDIINEEKILKLVLDKEGLFKGSAKYSKRYVLLNKMDDEKTKKIAFKIINLLKQSNFRLDGIISASMKFDKGFKV
jgi:probable selenium-dependent hydroxylase accessory protein YqeC